MVITFKQETAIHYITDIIKLFSSTKMLYWEENYLGLLKFKRQLEK